MCICIAFAFQGNVFEIRIRSGITFEDGCLTLICRLLIYIVRRSLPRHSAGVGNHAANARLPGRQPLLAHFIQSPSSHGSAMIWLGRKSQRANRAESGPVVLPSSWRYNFLKLSSWRYQGTVLFWISSNMMAKQAYMKRYWLTTQDILHMNWKVEGQTDSFALPWFY